MRARPTLRWSAALLAVLLLAGCGEERLKTVRQEAGAKATAFVIGDVRKVLAGTLEETDFVAIEPRSYVFALGAGTLGPPEGTGELLVVGEEGFVKSVDEALGYPAESSKEGVRCPFCAGVLAGSTPARTVSLKGPRGMPVSELYAKLASLEGGVLGVMGVGRFARLETTAIRRAPVYGEPIMAEETRERYFHPKQVREDVVGVFGGLLADPARQATPDHQAALERLFYVNYADKTKAELASHTHVVFLKEPFPLGQAGSPSELALRARPADVEDIRHLLTQSVLTEAVVFVFRIDTFVQQP